MPQVKCVVFDDDVFSGIVKFQDYMNQDTRLPLNFSRAVNFLVDAYLKTLNTETKKTLTEVTQQ